VKLEADIRLAAFDHLIECLVKDPQMLVRERCALVRRPIIPAGSCGKHAADFPLLRHIFPRGFFMLWWTSLKFGLNFADVETDLLLRP
jgi:hypothetical protein